MFSSSKLMKIYIKHQQQQQQPKKKKNADDENL